MLSPDLTPSQTLQSRSGLFFKTCPEDEDEAKEVDNVAPVENIRSPRVNCHPAPVQQSRRKAESLLTEEVTVPSNPEQSVSEEQKLNSLSDVGNNNVESS
jgi:hypothetical protein